MCISSGSALRHWELLFQQEDLIGSRMAGVMGDELVNYEASMLDESERRCRSSARAMQVIVS